MSSKIDEKTEVPLGLVASLFVLGMGVTATGAFWVSRVDNRLARIEDKLGIIQLPQVKKLERHEDELAKRERSIYGLKIDTD